MRAGSSVLLAAGLFIALAGPAPASADEIDDLRADVERLQREVLLLQNQMPRGAAASGGTSLAAQQELRNQEWQQQVSALTGRIERLELRLADLEGRVARMQEDFDLRLTQLEQGGATPAPAIAVGEPASPAAMGEARPAEPSAPPNPSGVLGTLTEEQLRNLPPPPAGAAESAAASAAAAQSPEALYQYAAGLMQKKDWAKAEAAWRDFLARYPSHARAGNAQYWLGETYFARADYKRAQTAFAEGYQKYPKSPKAPDNLLKLGISLGKNDRAKDACTAFRQLAKQFPDAAADIQEKAKRYRELYKCG